MFSYGQFIQFAKRFDSNNNSTFGTDLFQDLVRDAIQTVWSCNSWPFHFAQGTDEGVISLYPVFQQGSLTVTNGSTSIVFNASATAHADWDPSNWPFPASLETGSGQENYLVLSISGSTGVIDHPYHDSNASVQTYSLGFTRYALPSDFASMCRPEVSEVFSEFSEIPYSEYLAMRVRGVWDGDPRLYSVVGEDGINAANILLWPPPNQKQLIRFGYNRKLPDLQYYDEGTIAVTNSASAATGTSTKFSQMGWSAAGAVLELKEYAKHYRHRVVASSGDTGLNLSGSWQNQTYSGASFMLSSEIRLPDYILPALREQIKIKTCEARRDYKGMAQWELMFKKAIRQAKARSMVIQESLQQESIGLTGENVDSVPKVARTVVANN